MKAVILEIKDGYAAVLSDDGNIVKTKNNNYEIGQVIQIKNSKIKFSKKIAAIAASAAAIAVLSTGTWAYASPYSYVSLDVNPSIEFSINRFDRVIHVKAVNDDGEKILQDISLSDLTNKTIEDAITTTVDQISQAGYFDSDIEGGIVITTSGKDEDRASQLAQDLRDTVEQEFTVNGDDVQVDALSVGLERVKEAKTLGVTPGKLNLVEKLQQSANDPSSINIEEWLNKPVREIMKATNNNRKAAAVSGSAITNDSNNKNVVKSDNKPDMAKQRSDHRSSDISSEKIDHGFDKSNDKADHGFDKSNDKADHGFDKSNDKAVKANDKVNQTKNNAGHTVKGNDNKASQNNNSKSKGKDKKTVSPIQSDAKPTKKPIVKPDKQTNKSDKSAISDKSSKSDNKVNNSKKSGNTSKDSNGPGKKNDNFRLQVSVAPSVAPKATGIPNKNGNDKSEHSSGNINDNHGSSSVDSSNKSHDSGNKGNGNSKSSR